MYFFPDENIEISVEFLVTMIDGFLFVIDAIPIRYDIEV